MTSSSSVKRNNNRQQIILFPNNLLEEVEGINGSEPISASTATTTATVPRPSYTSYTSYNDDRSASIYDDFPIYGRDLSTVKSPPLASSIYHYATVDFTRRRFMTTPSLLSTTTTFLPGSDYSLEEPAVVGDDVVISSSTTSLSIFEAATNNYDIIISLNDSVTVGGSEATELVTPPSLFNATSEVLALDWAVVAQQVETTTPLALAIAIFLLIFPVITVCGNLLVVLSVATERTLRSSTNYYIVSLAFADILVGALVMPFAVYVELVDGVWRLGDLACDVWIACDVMACTASILHLVAISVDRLLAVTKPVLYAHNKSFFRVWFSIGAAWLTSALIASPITFGANNMANRQPLLCTFYNADFILASSFGSFYIPSIAIVAPYFFIFRTLQRRAKKLHRMRYGGGPSSTSPRQRLGKASAIDSQCFGQQSSVALMRDGGTTTGTGTGTKKDPETATSPLDPSPAAGKIGRITEMDKMNFGGVYLGPSADVDEEKPQSNNTQSKKSNYLEVGTGNGDAMARRRASEAQKPRFPLQRPPEPANRNRGAATTIVRANGEKCCVTTTVVLKNTSSAAAYQPKMKRAAMTKERRATVMTVVVLALFFGCWVPFFTASTVNAVCIRFFGGNRCVAGFLMSIFVWLGYINSLMNPVVYAVFNPEFRKTFKKILHLY